MDALIKTIYTTPIIDNHAHPLLIPSARDKYPLLAITTEAHGDAMRHTTSALSHIRAVKQLSDVLKCPASWDEVLKAIDIELAKPHHAWEKRCFEGIEAVLVDDGLDGKDEVYDYSWHDKLTRSESKRIVRIEKVAEELINNLYNNPDHLRPEEIFVGLKEAFDLVMRDAVDDPEVVGFKSIICYRTGLDIPALLSTHEVKESFLNHIDQLRADGVREFKRLDSLPLNAYLVNRAASIISKSPSPKKPLQFHTGLGDNDITLTKSSPSHLQEFIRKYPSVPIVLLHASYPWTKEAGYLASVYENVYADIGEVFPFLSKEGQVNVVREILELAPSEKILWSTDGHWFPETYLLAVMQVREAFEVVFSEYVQDGVLTIPQAIKAVEDIFFNTSNDLYDLELPLIPLPVPTRFPLNQKLLLSGTSDLQILTTFLEKYPTTKFIRMQWIDYTATARLRVIPTKRALAILQKDGKLQTGVTEAGIILLQNDTVVPGIGVAKEYDLTADFSSLRLGPSPGYASVYSTFNEKSGEPVAFCPRATLERVLQSSSAQHLDFLIGFEIEIVFMSRLSNGNLAILNNSAGHAWSSSRALHDPVILAVLTEIYDTLADASIELDHFEPESAPGQYEFVLPPYPPMESCDTLLHTREIITTVTAKHGLRATMIPKPFKMSAGTASHVHLSISSPGGDDKEVYESFYAGVLKHMQSIIAFTYSNPASYDRMVDSCWAGGRWVTWGTQNKETALRKIEGSHFEIKVFDGLANVYLAVAAILAAGTQGVKNQEVLKLGDCRKDPALLTAEERNKLGISELLPSTLVEAMKNLEANKDLQQLLGEEVVKHYAMCKEAELKLLSGMEENERRTWIMERY